MELSRRKIVLSTGAASVFAASPALWAQAPKTTKKLVLGQSVSMTGPAFEIGLAYMHGAKMCFDALNAKNAISGYAIEVKTKDDGYVATKAASAAKEFIAEGVDALFGFAGTASCDAAYAVAKPSDTIFFAPFAASDALHDPALTNVFHVRPSLADEAYKMAKHCETLGLNKIAVFAEDDAMGRAGLAAITQALVDLKRPPIVASAFSPLNSSKVEPAVAALMKAQPQAIIQVSLYTSAAAFIRQMRQAKYGGQFLTFSVVGIDPLFTELGKEIGGIVISQVMPSPRSTGTPIIKEYLDVLNQTDETPSYQGVEGYIAAKSFAEGVRRSVAATGKAERAGLQKAFESMNNYDAGGFRVNLRPRRYESVRAIDLVSILPSGKVVR